ncbi:HAD-IA family hydrolase [Vibrio sp. Isolate31]|uniref:HAD-IA family hydrolase n=1 Tax=unclassified Vibrio TaxID=2614977 RepID=UPI001EFC3D53|nr:MULTISPECIES: HAD-IA family hydrolase [unclassified Vibrio]MCG9553617.1 HAD-IA family hydrolase [Vibrio sp. Isolate32]MCG9601708.1 HAD-IA family hydrolase [Vibrio sp. Isolate31]
MHLEQTKCVIFDCDGTLIDSEKLCCQALVNVFGEFGAKLNLNDCYAHFQGGKLADILMDTQARLGLSISIDILEPLYRTELEALFQRHLKPMDGAIELIEFLKHQDIEFCIASNAPKHRVESSLAMTGMLDDFKGKVFSAFDANSWKPEPDLIMYTAMNMGFLPNECIYVDDTLKGIEAGVRAGIQSFRLRPKVDETLSDDPKADTAKRAAQDIYSLEEISLWINGKQCSSGDKPNSAALVG